MKNENVFKKEEVFHDEWANSTDINKVMVDEFFEACTAPENRFILKSLGDINGKKVLDVGCGLGESSVYFAKKGANVMATDISEGMLEVAQKLAAKHKVNIQTKKSYSDKLDFADESFDIVYVANLLHHVDIDSTLKEIKRVLKKDGVFVSWDPLAHNPVINIYRRMAMGVRTEDEHPIRMGELKLFEKYFPKITYQTTWFFTLFIFLKFYLIDRVHPNQERYWKKIIIEHNKLEKLYTRLEKFDQVVLKAIPFLKRYCWNIVIIGKK